jgi:hypothetical protein
VSGIFKFFEISFGNLSRAVFIHEEPPKTILGFDVHICGVAMRFHFINGFFQKYNGFVGDNMVFAITFDNMLESAPFSLRIARFL